ncbi:hypothetical protein GBF38_009013 [Nibea albiflora]|uniref:Uncharacterized protein n=1 Tax=Nibea albiflora TaxID=240163 RepID=A0ACB7ERH2_NIBAL|nr:hypothetical protein GBF38_009013 [Nibea albiflora]
MAEEMTVLQQSALEGQKTFWNELDELRTKLIAQVSLNLELSTELQAEREALQKIAGRDDNQPPKEAEEAEDKQCEQQAPISPALVLEPQREARGNLPDRTPEPTFCLEENPSLSGVEETREVEEEEGELK